MSATQTWSGRVTSRPSTRLGNRGYAWPLSVVRGFLSGAFAHDPQLVHQPPHPLGVDPQALALEHRRQATVSVGRPRAGQLSQGVFDRPVLVRPGFVVQAAAMHAQDLAQHIASNIHHATTSIISRFWSRPHPAASRLFLGSRSARVMRPSTCSSSAIRAWSAIAPLVVEDQVRPLQEGGLPERQQVRARGRACGTPQPGLDARSGPPARPCALNSGVNRRRFLIPVRLRLDPPPIMHLSSFRAHYSGREGLPSFICANELQDSCLIVASGGSVTAKASRRDARQSRFARRPGGPLTSQFESEQVI